MSDQGPTSRQCPFCKEDVNQYAESPSGRLGEDQA